MKTWIRTIGLLTAVLVWPASAMSAPTVEPTAAQSDLFVIPFSPPLDQPIKFRNEKTVMKDDKSVMTWSIESYRFEKATDGYRLTITPVEYGTDDKDPIMAEMMRKLGDLINQPYVLKLGTDGEIMAMERADEYWSRIVGALKDALSGKAGDLPTPTQTAVIKSVFDIYSNIPPETRLALLTETPQAVLDLGGLEIDPAEPISVEVESNSPFGGTIKREMTITLGEVQPSNVAVAVNIDVPPEELSRLMQVVAERFKAAFGNDAEKVKAGLATLKDFRHQTRSDYRVSRTDGLLSELTSTETIEVSDQGKRSGKTTVRTIRRLD